jgi:hypothetical protein
MASFVKHQYVRSKVLMAAYRAIPCQHCGLDDGTVCGAHSNLLSDGKGRGIKADDNKGASMCFKCHASLDQGSKLSKAERTTMHRNAHVKTVRELVRRGLWPLDIQIPDIRFFN